MAQHKTNVRENRRIAPDEVHDLLAGHLIADGLGLVLDLERSSGSWLVDARTGQRYLDLYTFFASAPLGLNHPQLVDDPAFLAELARVAVTKPANPDVYTTAYAEFVSAFVRVLGDPALPHLFFVEGGALAVENALKVAFDWKSRLNEASGRDRRLGGKILHLTSAFHGRSGYTLSLTNTEPGKTDRFPTFDWPRIDAPAIKFPLRDHLEEVVAAEQRALAQARRAFEKHPHDIAAFVAEPIQGEGGDHHFRAEFFAQMIELVHSYDALFLFDEVQTGGGTTGTPWAYQQLGITPDVVAFAKKVQVGGIMAGGRVDEVPDHVFAVPGRINSTWGGGLVDMVRSRRILEIVESEGLIEAAAKQGSYFLTGLEALSDVLVGPTGEAVLSQPRGRGLMIAVDLPSREIRDAVLTDLRLREHVLALGCGARALRFRPALSVRQDEIDEALAALNRSVTRITSSPRENR